MRIVLLNQFYPPDVAPTGAMLQAVTNQLVANGHDVTILCASNSYAGKRVRKPPDSAVCSAVIINRIRVPSLGGRSALGKILSYFFYTLGVAWNLLWRRADLVVVMTTPPFLSVIARLFTMLRGARIAHWVMDLYPDVMTAYGMVTPGSVRDRVLQSIARWGFGGRRCRLILTLGPDMAARVLRLTGPQRPCEWVPLWGTALGDADCGKVVELRKERNWKAGETVFVYSGNMGLGHRFAEFIEAARSLSPDCGIRLAYFGNGGRKKEIAALLADWRDGPHSINGYVDAACLAVHLQTADVHLASLEPAWDGTMLPSKLQGIFAAGRPVIFTGSKTGSMGQWILESGAGWVCEPGDIEAHRQAILEAMDPEVRRRRGAAALEYSNQHFNRDKNVQRIAALLEKCVQ